MFLWIITILNTNKELIKPPVSHKNESNMVNNLIKIMGGFKETAILFQAI